ALNVRSITLPSAALRSFVRTNAPPLPGLTCWNSRILKIVPSTSMWFPFLNWLVLMAIADSLEGRSALRHWSVPSRAPDYVHLHPGGHRRAFAPSERDASETAIGHA